MDDSSKGSFTLLLQRSRAGEGGALDELLPLVYEELRALAGRQLRERRDAPTLQPTALVHEVYLRLVDQEIAGPADRAHFLALCGRIMRRVLVDHLRRRRALKRGGGAALRLETEVEPSVTEHLGGFDLLALDEALERLAALDPRKAQVVELRYFCGASVEEVAESMGLSKRTVEGDWFLARAWLRSALAEG